MGKEILKEPETTTKNGPKGGCDKPSKCCEEGTCSLPKDNKWPDPN